MKYPCNYTVWAWHPHDIGTLRKAGVLYKQDHYGEQQDVVDLMQLLNRMKYEETITIAQDDTSLNVFYDDWLGWRIITTDVKAR